MYTTVVLTPFDGTWDADDPHANFKDEVALYSKQDPVPMFDNLSAATGIPRDALIRYALVKWGSEGTETLLHAGPRLVRRMQRICADAQTDGSVDARIQALETLTEIIDWLALPLGTSVPEP